MEKQKSIILNVHDVNNILNWYRCSHHFSHCDSSIKGCHKTKNKILDLAKKINGVK